jgi:murein DD-endopeptidase MepM/ murein hydrolase activator NlpD
LNTLFNILVKKHKNFEIFSPMRFNHFRQKLELGEMRESYFLQDWRDRSWFLILGLFLIFGLLLSFTTASYAQTVDQLKNYQGQVEQQKKVIKLYRDQLQRVAKPAEERLDALTQSIQATEEQIDTNSKKLASLKSSLVPLTKLLERQETNLNLKRLAVVARLRYLQKQEQGQWWAMLLSSQNLNQFSDRRRQLAMIYQSDRQLLGELKQNWDKVESQRKQIVKLSNEVSLVKQQLTQQKSGFQAEATKQNQVVSRLRNDRRALEDAEDRLAEDSKQLAQVILAKSQVDQGLSLPPGSGQMIYPVTAPVTSEFGWRTHPILGYEKFHAGVDFGADYGTAIYAAAAGKVIFAGWYGGYGNAVVIAHGSGITTLYAHASEIYVADGQDIQQGQPIATVGSSGFSTGPHLHFEVRANGEPTDPAPYL